MLSKSAILLNFYFFAFICGITIMYFVRFMLFGENFQNIEGPENNQWYSMKCVVESHELAEAQTFDHEKRHTWHGDSNRNFSMIYAMVQSAMTCRRSFLGTERKDLNENVILLKNKLSVDFMH